MKKQKKCPACARPLKEVYAKATYGRVLLLDQCPECGGLWFDQWELYFLKDSEAQRLDALNLADLYAANPPARGTKRCPSCGAGLADFNDPGLPPDADILRCPDCSGLWLNRGELTRYSSHRASLTGAKRKAEVKGPDIETLKNLQKALDTSAITTPWTPEIDDTPIEAREIARDLAPIILQILFKLVFKF
ncbi:MAG: hypothetical protein BMS9Abin23_0253 [Thermodesulfobacteriota bacterium]|nr:MAG: hypothetical protein BMS9Abin23_0253 [Thermodesulfobacteriota bacterium]